MVSIKTKQDFKDEFEFNTTDSIGQGATGTIYKIFSKTDK